MWLWLVTHLAAEQANQVGSLILVVTVDDGCRAGGGSLPVAPGEFGPHLLFAVSGFSVGCTMFWLRFVISNRDRIIPSGLSCGNDGDAVSRFG